LAILFFKQFGTFLRDLHLEALTM